MSTESTTLADFVTPEAVEPTVEQSSGQSGIEPSEPPLEFVKKGDSNAENRCRNCGGHVTEDFGRVFGNNHNEVFGCLECMTATEVKKGGARAESVETSVIGGMEPL